MIHTMWMRTLIFSVVVLAAVSTASAQQKFPLRPGEWTATMTFDPSVPPMTVLYCLNDDLWNKTLTQNGTCTVTMLTATSSGLSYNISCKMPPALVTGKAQMDFDGMQHMVAKTVMTLTMNGKSTPSTNLTDYRWKGPACSPADKNLNKGATK